MRHLFPARCGGEYTVPPGDLRANLPPDMLPAFVGLHILTEENRKRLSSFGRKQKGNGRAIVRTMKHITHRIVLPDDTINRRKAKGCGICGDRRTLGAAHCFNRTPAGKQLAMPGKRETEKGVPVFAGTPFPCVLQLMLKFICM